jgi:hypothetical protein
VFVHCRIFICTDVIVVVCSKAEEHISYFYSDAFLCLYSFVYRTDQIRSLIAFALLDLNTNSLIGIVEFFLRKRTSNCQRNGISTSSLLAESVEFSDPITLESSSLKLHWNIQQFPWSNVVVGPGGLLILLGIYMSSCAFDEHYICLLVLLKITLIHSRPSSSKSCSNRLHS